MVQPQNGGAAKACIVASDLQFGEHVAHDAWHGTQVCKGHHAPVHWAYLLLGEPLSDASIAESMFAMRSLGGRITYSTHTHRGQRIESRTRHPLLSP